MQQLAHGPQGPPDYVPQAPPNYVPQAPPGYHLSQVQGRSAYPVSDDGWNDWLMSHQPAIRRSATPPYWLIGVGLAGLLGLSGFIALATIGSQNAGARASRDMAELAARVVESDRGSYNCVAFICPAAESQPAPQIPPEVASRVQPVGLLRVQMADGEIDFQGGRAILVDPTTGKTAEVTLTANGNTVGLTFLRLGSSDGGASQLRAPSGSNLAVIN